MGELVRRVKVGLLVLLGAGVAGVGREASKVLVPMCGERVE